MRRGGKTNLLTVVLIAALIGGGYWGLIFGPIYLDNFEVKEKVDEGFARAGWESQDAIRQTLIVRLAGLNLGKHMEYDRATGEWKEKQGLGIPDENVVVLDDTVRKMLAVSVSYERTVMLWPTKKTRTVKFLVEHKGTYAK